VQDVFLPEEYYDFEEVLLDLVYVMFFETLTQNHYDGVIHNYREVHLSSWKEFPGLSPILDRLHSLLPTQNIQTHLLHLASKGKIDPHIDNTDATGNWIVGVSLGASRILRINGVANSDSFDVLLPSGSVYIQSDVIRYKYMHSILADAIFEGQRLSVMIRVWNGFGDYQRY
jgi:alkylated DNA repair protein alkB family protein 7